MRKPAADKEDPNVVAAREREERRAESARTSETQALLIGATQRRLRRTGRLAPGGSVPLIAPSSGGASSGGGSGGFSGGGFSGAGGGFGGSTDYQTALY